MLRQNLTFLVFYNTHIFKTNPSVYLCKITVVNNQ